MSAEAEPSSRPWKAADDGLGPGEEDGVDSQHLGGGQEEQGDLQHRDYDVETVERVYRCATDQKKKTPLPIIRSRPNPTSNMMGRDMRT